MYKRKSSGRESRDDDDLEGPTRSKIPTLEETLQDDEDVDDDFDENKDNDEDYDEDDDDEENEEDDNECNLKNQKDKSKNINFIPQNESDAEKTEGTVRKNTNIGYAMMRKYGYKEGAGLGKFLSGIVEPVEPSKQKGTRGFGFQSHKLTEVVSKYDPNVKDEIFDEEITWLINSHAETLSTECLKSWVKCGPPLTKLDKNSPFCESHIISGIIESKSVLDTFSDKEKKNGRRRSNPFESICNAIFLNRAAMKMANMDAILDNMFTEPKTKTGEKLVGPNELLYFADVCAGPGGFSEYVLYRKRWRAKGFGFTLKNENDFKLDQFIAGPPETFEPHYGVTETGDIFVPENINKFRDDVMKYTNNIGVHFMMADGGIPIGKDLCEQEIKCKKLYLCQCIVALLIVRPGGHFVVKLFDLFTEFSVGLVYLVYRSFEEILIIKPKTSRPANSERYLVCKRKRNDCGEIADHLFEINKKVPSPNENLIQDVLELVPIDVLENDKKFFHYIKSTNEKLGERQIKSLCKMAAFSENNNLVEPRQQELRKKCLAEWNIPVEARAEPKKVEPRSKWMELVGSSSLLESEFCNRKNKVTSFQFFDGVVKSEIHNWHAIILCLEESSSTCGFYLGLGKNNVHRYSGGKWVKLNSITLCLPANTIVYGEVVYEFSGTARSQTKIQAFHIIDGLFLGGEDIRHRSFRERGKMCALFAKALFKEACPVRVKKSCLLEDIEQLWHRDNLVFRLIKSSRLPVLAVPLDESSFYKATGVMFVRDLRDPSNLYLNKSGKFFVDNTKTQKFESNVKDQNISKPIYADFENCFLSRLIWWWDEGVIIHDDQTSRPDPNKMQKKDIMNLIDSIKSKRPIG